MKIVPTYLDAALQSGFKLRTSSWQAKTDPLDNGDPPPIASKLCNNFLKQTFDHLKILLTLL